MTDAEKLKKLRDAVQQVLSKQAALATLYGPDAEYIFKYAPELAKALGCLAGPLQNLIKTVQDIK